MKKILPFLLLWLLSHLSIAQFVGIGTSDPKRNLHVHQQTGLGNVDVSIGITNNLTGSLATDGARLRMVDFDFIIQNNESAGYLSLVTGSFDRLFIKPNGNIGINNTDPQTVLHINARPFPNPNYNEAIRLGGTTPYISFYDDATLKGYVQASLGGFELGAKSAQSINFFTNDAQRMTILNDGKVGIGINNPSRLFQVSGAENLNEVAEFHNTVSSTGAAVTARVNGATESTFISLPKAFKGLGGDNGIGVMGHSTGSGWGVYGVSRQGVGGFFNAVENGVSLWAISNNTNVKVALFEGSSSGFAVPATVHFKNTVPSVAESNIPFAFQVTGNGSSSIIIPNTGHANSSTDLIFIQHKTNGVAIPSPVYVYWNGSSWAIFREDLGIIPIGEIFNVMVIKQ